MSSIPNSQQRNVSPNSPGPNTKTHTLNAPGNQPEFWVRFSNERNQGKQGGKTGRSCEEPGKVPGSSQARPGWAPDPRWAGGWACTNHPGVLGSIPKREKPGKTGRHPVSKYRVPHGFQNLIANETSLVPSPPPARSFIIVPAVIDTHTSPRGGGGG